MLERFFLDSLPVGLRDDTNSRILKQVRYYLKWPQSANVCVLYGNFEISDEKMPDSLKDCVDFQHLPEIQGWCTVPSRLLFKMDLLENFAFHRILN